jgi:hypothetical protein
MLDRLLKKLFYVDERFIMHRYYSTRLAMVVGILMIAVWFCYELLVNDQLRLDLVIISGAMALAKIAAMLYYRITH